MKYGFRNIVLLVLFFINCIMQTGCSSSEKKETAGFVITGNIQGIESDSVYLYNTLMDSFVSAVAVHNDHFIFKGHVEYPEMFQVYFNTGDTLFKNVFVENAGITMSGDINNLSAVTISGSAVNTEYTEQRESISPIIENAKSIDEAINKAKENSDFDLSDSLQNTYDSISLVRLKKVYAYSLENKGSAIIPYITFNAGMNAPNKEWVDKIFATLDKSSLDNPRVKAVYTMLTDLTKVAIGTQAPGFEANTNLGTSLTLNAFKNKVVLLDFWASWCKPCRLSHPGLITIYNKFKTKEFGIISFSIDTNEEAWKQAIAKDGLTWPQVIDLNGPDGKAPKDYGIYFVPTTYLIDKNGQIAAINIHGKKLEEKIAALIQQ